MIFRGGSSLEHLRIKAIRLRSDAFARVLGTFRMPSPSTDAYIGAVFISILVACCNSTGMGLQKRVHLELASARDAAPAAPRAAYWKDPRWAVGLVCMFLASMLVLVNYSLLDQSRASAFSSLTIVSNAVMAKFYLRETFTRYDAVSAALILTGVVICGIFGATASSGSPSTLDQLWAQLSRTVVYVVAPLVAALAAALHLLIRRSEAEALAGRRSHLMHRLECFGRAFLAGIFSGSTGFFAKAVVCAVSDSLKTRLVSGSLGNPKFYLFLAGLPLSIFCQLKTLNEGLRAFDTMELVPIYQASVVAVGVSWGWVFYEENKDLSYGVEGFFLLGCFISVTGIAVLSLKKVSDVGEGKGEGDALLPARGREEFEPLLLVGSPGGSSLVAQDGGGSGAGALPALSREPSQNPFRSTSSLTLVTGSLYKPQQSFYTPHLL